MVKQNQLHFIQGLDLAYLHQPNIFWQKKRQLYKWCRLLILFLLLFKNGIHKFALWH